jgi:hypothetical protein
MARGQHTQSWHLSPGRQPAESPQHQLARLSVPIPECGCWAWLGKIGVHGYADMSYRIGPQKRVTRRAAKVAWELDNATEFPTHLELDHICHSRWCVNPDHLRAVTHSENIRSRRPFKQTRDFCKNGHLLANAPRASNGACLICTRQREKEWRVKNRERLRAYERFRR